MIKIHIKLTKNKTLESLFHKQLEWDYFEFDMKWTRRQDHAGFYLYLEITGLCYDFSISDNRHYSYKLKRYKKGF